MMQNQVYPTKYDESSVLVEGRQQQQPPQYSPPHYQTQPASTVAYQHPTTVAYQHPSTVAYQHPTTVVQMKDHVEDNTVISIVSIFFCCILGLIATVKSHDSKSHLRQGNIQQAKSDSQLARRLAIAAIIAGIVIIVITIVISVILPLIGFGIIAGMADKHHN